MTRYVDRLLDRITMYRLVLNYLGVLVIAALVLSLLGFVPFAPEALGFSVVLIVATCWLTNRIFARTFNVPANIESVYITALIVALIVDPVSPLDIKGIGAVIFASVWAVAGKFIVTFGRKHLLNPAALGVFGSGLLLDRPATWWVGGTLALLPLVLVGGFFVVRRIRRGGLVATFVLVNLLTVAATSSGAGIAPSLMHAMLSSPLFFFAFVMLTEPLTAPTDRWARLLFAALVGFLSAPNVHIIQFFFTPELALLIGNLFAFIVGPKRRFVLTLERIEHTSAGTFDFVFNTPRRLAFQAGQYVECTLPVTNPDNRGNRRYFTLASAPTEKAVRLGVKFYPASSAFKRALASMTPGDEIHTAQITGDFTLPDDPKIKLAFIAGGIGITPFRSMLQYLRDRHEARHVTILYGNERQQDIAYGDILDAAEDELGIVTVYAIARDPGPGQYPGYIDARLINEVIPDYRERIFYVSGPQAMVKAMRQVLRTLGVHRSCIKVDFFPGFA